MKIKRIMLIAFLLLAVLTIGGVSAADDVASDNMTVSDDADIVADGAYDDYDIEVYDEICLDEDDEEYDEEATIADITLPKKTKGSFQILNNETIVARVDVNEDDEDHWSEYDGDLYGSILLTDVNLTKINDGDELTFKFLKLSGGSYVEISSFTQVYKVRLTDSLMKLSKISSNGMTDEDVNFEVKNIDFSKPNENFTYVNVTQKEGYFIITLEGEDDDIYIIKENLNISARPYVQIDNENGIFYRFGFSFTDINNYIVKQGYKDFNDLIDKEGVEDGNDITFGLYEDEDGEEEIYSETMTITIKDDGITFKDEEYGNEEIEVDYNDTLEIIMTEDWQETELFEFTVSKEISGKIVIYLNNNETPAFEKNITDLTSTDVDDEDYNYYSITIKDLNITQEGKYIIRPYFYDKNGTQLYPEEDDEEIQTLVLYKRQNMTVGNVTIDVNPTTATIDGNESLITINASANEEDKVLIYVDGNETALQINISDCRKDDDGNYIIGADDLNLGAGEHDIKLVYKGNELNAKVNLVSKLVIELPNDDEIIYANLEYSFVSIRLEEEEIRNSNINGTINLTIMDNSGNIITTFEKNITSLTYNEESRAYEIYTEDVEEDLNGTYTVIVRYFGGNEADTQVEGNVTFRLFNPEEYGTSIKDTINDKNDTVITFKALLLKENIFVGIDGNKPVEIDESTLNKWFDQEKGVYYIKYDSLNGLTEGPHSIIVYFETESGLKELTRGNVLINLEKMDPSQLKPNGSSKDSTKTTGSTETSKPTTQNNKKADTIKITLKKVKIKKSAKKLVIKATLKINGKAVKGKKITFKFKGKTYKVKTNKKGVAKLTIKKKVLKKLKVGKKVTYSAKYLTKTVKKTVKVKK